MSNGTWMMLNVLRSYSSFSKQIRWIFTPCAWVYLKDVCLSESSHPSWKCVSSKVKGFLVAPPLFLLHKKSWEKFIIKKHHFFGVFSVKTWLGSTIVLNYTICEQISRQNLQTLISQRNYSHVSSSHVKIFKPHRKPNEIRSWDPVLCILVVSSRGGISHHSEIWLPAVTERNVEMTFLVHVIKEESIAGGRGLFISACRGQTGQLCFACLIMSVLFGGKDEDTSCGAGHFFCFLLFGTPSLCLCLKLTFAPLLYLLLLLIATLGLNYIKSKLSGEDVGAAVHTETSSSSSSSSSSPSSKHSHYPEGF